METKKLGRPITQDIKTKGNEYYKEYARKNNINVQCSCGCIVKKNYLSKHLKSNKHFKTLEFINIK